MTDESQPAAGSSILVVDDDEFVCNSLKWLLIDDGYEVEVAVDGRTALEMFSRRTFDLVLTDLMMPGVDGLMVLREVKRISPFTAVIILTGYGTLEAAMSALKEGAYDFLTKPCDDGEMKYKIEGALEQKRLRERLSELEGLARKATTARELLAGFSGQMDREIERMRGLSAEEVKTGLAALRSGLDEVRRAIG